MGMTQDLTALLVRNNETGEILPFTLTRAGFYKLAKYAAAMDNQEMIVAVKNLSQRDDIATICGRHIYSKIAKDVATYLFGDNVVANAYWHWFEINFTNICDCKDGRCRFKSDCFKLHGYWYPKAWRKYLTKCEECGELFFDQKLIEEDGKDSIISKIYYGDIGYNGQCNGCLDYNLRQCADCGRIFNENNEDYAIIDGDYICDDCLSSGDYCRCDSCGEWFRSDSDYAQFVGDYCYCSSECCENDGWHWSDRREEWVSEDDYYEEEECNEVDGIITDYHSHCYDPIGDEFARKNQKHDLYIGRETEVDGLDRYDYSYDYFSNLQSVLLGDTCFLETDGSLEGGFEIISQPMTEKAFFKQDWDKAFSKLISDGWRSHDTSTCGTHYHFSKWYLGYTNNEQKNNAKKVCRFFQLFADDIKKIARRDFNHYCIDLNKFRGGAINEKTDFYDLSGDRYWAVNLTNLTHRTKGTIEIRICKGTLKTSTMLASADLFLHIVRNAKRISWKNIDNIKLWLKGIKNPNTIEYIKARHAFSGAF